MPRRSGAGRPVDGLTQHVGVAVVPGVFAYQVYVDEAQRAETPIAQGECVVHARLGGDAARLLLLGEEAFVIVLCTGRDSVLEVGVGTFRGRIEPGHRLAPEAFPQPDAFHFGQMPHQAEQRQVGERQGPQG